MQHANPELVSKLHNAQKRLAVASAHIDAAKNRLMRDVAEKIFDAREMDVEDAVFDLHYNSREGRAYRASKNK